MAFIFVTYNDIKPPWKNDMPDIHEQNLHARFAATDQLWSNATARLAHAIMERALSMELGELRQFIAPTPDGHQLARTGDNELNGMIRIARNVLL